MMVRHAAEVALGPAHDPVLGRHYAVTGIPIDPAEAALYAEAAGDPSRYDGLGTHPCFVVNPAMRGLQRLLGDSGLGITRAGMLHAQCDLWFAAPLVPTEAVDISAFISEAGPYGTRQAYRITSEVRDQRGRLRVAIDNILAFPTAFLPGAEGRPPLRLDRAPTVHRPAVAVATVTVPEDLPARYARASRDDNPIHLDPVVARAAGLPGVIVHGMSVFALGATVVIASIGGGDALRLRRMRVRFSKPLRPGLPVTFELFETDLPETFFLTANADGESLWRQAVAEIREETS